MTKCCFFWCLHIFKQWFITPAHTARFLFWSPRAPMKEVLCQGITPGCPNYSHMGPHQPLWHTNTPLCLIQADREEIERLNPKCNIYTKGCNFSLSIYLLITSMINRLVFKISKNVNISQHSFQESLATSSNCLFLDQQSKTQRILIYCHTLQSANPHI